MCVDPKLVRGAQLWNGVTFSPLVESWPLDHGPWPVAEAHAIRVPPVRLVTVTIGQSHSRTWALHPGAGTSIRSVGGGAMVVAALLFAFITQASPAYEIQRMVKLLLSHTSGATRRGNTRDVEKGAPEDVVPLTVTRPNTSWVPGHWG